jgi:hypothetical protein
MKKAAILLLILIGLGGAMAQDRGVKVKIKKLDQYSSAGTQYLVIIGINKYKEWPPLRGPVTDVKEIRNILVERYYIDKVVELFDEEATKGGIIKLFKTLQNELKPADSLLLFYAGHGHLDQASNTGFWIPVDGGTDVDMQENWLPNAQIRGFISNIKSRHICVVSDSCFSGDMLSIERSSAPQINNDYFAKAYKRISRQVVTSGALETVPDKSEFAQQIKLVLEGNNYPYLDPLMLFNEVRTGVKKTSPLFGSLRDTGHQEGASFLLFLKEENESASYEDTTETYSFSSGTGSLVVKCNVPGLDLFIDGKKQGSIGDSKKTQVKGLRSGDHKLELIDENRWYYEGRVKIEKDKTKTLSVNPDAVGGLDLDVENYFTAQIINSGGFEKTIEFNTTLANLKTGTYAITVKGENYLDYTEKVTVRQGEVASFVVTGKMAYTDRYLTTMLSDELQKMDLSVKQLNKQAELTKQTAEILDQAQERNLQPVITQANKNLQVLTALIEEQVLPDVRGLVEQAESANQFDAALAACDEQLAFAETYRLEGLHDILTADRDKVAGLRDAFSRERITKLETIEQSDTKSKARVMEDLLSLQAMEHEIKATSSDFTDLEQRIGGLTARLNLSKNILDLEDRRISAKKIRLGMTIGGAASAAFGAMATGMLAAGYAVSVDFQQKAIAASTVDTALSNQYATDSATWNYVGIAMIPVSAVFITAAIVLFAIQPYDSRLQKKIERFKQEMNGVSLGVDIYQDRLAVTWRIAL